LTATGPSSEAHVKILYRDANGHIALYTIRYATTRSEIWRWYWGAWARPAGLWRINVLLGVAAALAAAAAQGFAHIGWSDIAVDVTVCTAICMVLLPLWPQLNFKPQVRTLEVNEVGYRTVIGRHKGERLWTQIRSIHDDGETVVLTTEQGSAMLIPRRAFAGAPDRGRFVADIKRWHAEATARRV
jgi:hypothetical protein